MASWQLTSAMFQERLKQFFKEIILRIKFVWGSLFYLTYTPHAYWYSFKRDRLEQRFAKPVAAETVKTPGKLFQAQLTAQVAHFYFEDAELSICFRRQNFVQVDWHPSLPPIPYALVKTPNASHFQNKTEIDIQLEEMTNGWVVSTPELKICVDTQGGLRFYNATGQLLREELPPQRRGEKWQHQIRLRRQESLYGFGERASRLNLRLPNIGEPPTQDGSLPKRTYRFWNYDAAGMYDPGSDPMYICIPVYISMHQQGSYLAFYENSYEATFTLEAEKVTADFEGGALRYYVAVGAPAELIEQYTKLTGKPPLPPRWALGYHQSRWGYRTEDAVRETVQQFKSMQLPLSAVHLDIDVQVGYRAFTLDPKRFPRLGEFTRELAEQDVQFVTILNPGVKASSKSKLYLEGQMLDAFCKLPNGELVKAPVWCGWSVFPDFTSQAVRHWWSRQYEFLLDLGVAGFWHDMNEPAAFIVWGDRSLPKVTYHKMEGRGGDHHEAHNLYGFLQARAGYESLCQYRPQQRPFIVSRSGWAGLQRYAWTWTGDIKCTWECMYQTIPTVLGLGLSGIPYSGPDIGGFQGNPSAELYLRWFQMATFLPFYRSHCSNNVEYRAPWTYGEPFLSIIRDFLNLRYRLMPYLYTLAWEASQKGYPLVRPLFWYHPDQMNLWDVDDAFYLGKALLIYPILQAGAQSRMATLPPGRWYSFWNDQILEGDRQVKLAAPMNQIPLLVKAGSILPMNLEKNLILHIYPPAEGSSESSLYNDAGDGYEEWRIDQFRIVRFEDGLELFWEPQGDYPLIYKFPYEEVMVVFHGFRFNQIWIDSSEVNPQQQMNDSGRVLKLSSGEQFRQAYFKGEFL